MIEPLTINPLKLEQPTTNEVQTFTGLELFNRSIDRIPMLIDRIIPKVGIWALVGSSDAGKSMCLRQMAISIATQHDFLEWNIFAEHRKAIFVSSEDDENSTSYLLKKQAPENSQNLENIRFYFDSENIPEILERELTSEPADLIIIDAWGDIFGQNLNDSALIRQTLNIYKRIADKHQCSIGFLHHTGKRTEKLAPSKNNILSGQGFEAKMRLVIELRSDNLDQNRKHFCIVKGNYLPKEYKDRSFVLNFNPETFSFTNTGERVIFEDLATITDNGKELKQKIKPDELSEDDHRKILTDVFKKKELKLGELESRISTFYGKHFNTEIGERITKRILSLLTTDLNLISDNGEKDRSPKKRYYLTTDDVN